MKGASALPWERQPAEWDGNLGQIERILRVVLWAGPAADDG